MKTEHSKLSETAGETSSAQRLHGLPKGAQSKMRPQSPKKGYEYGSYRRCKFWKKLCNFVDFALKVPCSRFAPWLIRKIIDSFFEKLKEGGFLGNSLNLKFSKSIIWMVKISNFKFRRVEKSMWCPRSFLF